MKCHFDTRNSLFLTTSQGIPNVSGCSEAHDDLERLELQYGLLKNPSLYLYEKWCCQGSPEKTSVAGIHVAEMYRQRFKFQLCHSGAV